MVKDFGVIGVKSKHQGNAICSGYATSTFGQKKFRYPDSSFFTYVPRKGSLDYFAIFRGGCRY